MLNRTVLDPGATVNFKEETYTNGCSVPGGRGKTAHLGRGKTAHLTRQSNLYSSFFLLTSLCNNLSKMAV